MSDKLSDGSGELRTYFSYDILGNTNLIAHRDAAENQSFVQRRFGSPSGGPLEFKFTLPDSPGDETISYDLDSAGRVKTVTWKDSVGSARTSWEKILKSAQKKPR